MLARGDYVPDFIIRLTTDDERYLILETKGHDTLADVKAAAAERWVQAVTADGSYGKWSYVMVREMTAIPAILAGAAEGVAAAADAAQVVREAAEVGSTTGVDDFPKTRPQHPPIKDLVALGESGEREFKSTLQWDVKQDA